MLRVGIVGTGTGLRTLLPGLRRTARAEVVAIAGRDALRCQRLAQAHGIENAVPSAAALCRMDLDLICIASPTALHVEHARMALTSSSANIYLEKPAGTTIDDVREIASHSGPSRQRMLVIGYQLRFNPHIRAIRQAVLRGAIGQTGHVEIEQRNERSASSSATDWRNVASLGGGARLDSGSHLVDLSRWLIGEEYDFVSASPDLQSERVGLVSDDFAVTLRAKNHTASLSGRNASRTGNGFSLVVRGSDGDIKFDFGSIARITNRRGHTEALVSTSVDADVSSRLSRSIFSTTFSYYAEAIVDALIASKPIVPDAATIDDAFETMRILEATLQSQRSGATVALRDVAAE